MNEHQRKRGPQLLDREEVPAIIGSRPSDIVTSDDEESMARMSDISNVTLGNQVAALTGVQNNSGIKKSPFLLREVRTFKNSDWNTYPFFISFCRNCSEVVA